ncbi:SufD family Fe-S cluster assembly protein, partial [Bacillus altitudinis]|uniref:SufD family Fe-S cluster assembly protein n=1 Tax=Bacillus altitudinis TaxID=293387 RepID=UPI003B52310C
MLSKSISKQPPKLTYPPILHFPPKPHPPPSNIHSHTLIIHNKSTSHTIPYNQILNHNISLHHQANLSKVSEHHLFYFITRQISQQEPTQIILIPF